MLDVGRVCVKLAERIDKFQGTRGEAVKAALEKAKVSFGD